MIREVKKKDISALLRYDKMGEMKLGVLFIVISRIGEIHFKQMEWFIIELSR